MPSDSHAANDLRIYLLMPLADIEAARQQGSWVSASYATEGFIHASPYEQLGRVANKHYRQKVDVCVVSVRVDQLKSELRWEPAAGSLYPHIYGPLNWEAVDTILPTQRVPNGDFVIPDIPQGS
jgi:uncharacterized protein (DUF952 family)